MSAQAAAVITAGSRPELFAEQDALPLTRRLLIVALALLTLAGFGFRVYGLSAEGLSEDEFNKLSAVGDYRAHGLTAANGEHPLLMKALQTVSIVAAESWNETRLARAYPERLRVPTEAALRFPSVIFGTALILLLYLFTTEFFGPEIGLIAAALWAFDPSAIGFNRIAKEDTFLLFFFLLANVFWLLSQRAAEAGRERPVYYWAAAASFGAMVASKYMPHYLTISLSYYEIFQRIPAARWRLGKPRFLLFFVIMGAAFILCNPTILLPDVWRQMLAFVSYKRIGHNGYEFMGTIYSHKLMDWLKGVPWYFYFVFMGVKLPLLTLAAFLTGLPLLFRRKYGDGRYFLLFWAVIGFMPFVFVGGKFTRYFTPVLPIVLIVAATGAQFVARRLARASAALFGHAQTVLYARAALLLLIIFASAWASASAAPFYRLYTNLIGGGSARAGYYFPQDEFYDGYMREVMTEVAVRAKAGARVASETPGLAAYYAQQAQRPDLACVSLSDPAALQVLEAGDLVIVARGRRYFSNDRLVSVLRQSSAPAFRVSLGDVPAVEVYVLDDASLASIRTTF
ncbi:MAG: glycosyltransferase family 39 protein [Pyrinomonadaceae bacterium]